MSTEFSGTTNWQMTKLSESVDIFDNFRKPINSDERQRRIRNKNVEVLFPYYGATGQVGWIDDFLTDGEYVLVGEDGAPFLDLFKPKAYKIRGKTWVNNHVHILKGKAGICIDDFILHYLNSINYAEYVNGTTRLKLTKGSLSEIPFPVPPIVIQHRIVSKIEELFSELDKGIEQLKTAHQQLKVYRQAVLKYAFEGSLTNKNVINGQLPDGWRKIKLSEISNITGGITKNSKRENFEIKLPFLRVANVYMNKLKLKEVHSIGLNENEIDRVTLKKNDLLFVEGNGSLEQIGRVALWTGEIENCVHQNHIIKCRLLPETDPKYILHFFTSKRGRDGIKEQASSTSGLHTLSLSKIKELQLPLPNFNEQQQIVQEIESRLSVCDKLEETIVSSLNQAEALRQSILKKAFEGKLLSENEVKNIRSLTYSIPEEQMLKIAAEPKTGYKRKNQPVQIQFPKVIEGIKTTDLHAGILAMVIDAHEKSPKHHMKLSHVKGEKIAHLVEAYVGIDLGRVPKKDAAGPDDFPHLKKVESRAAKAGWFGVKKLRVGQTYVSKSGMPKIIKKVKETLPGEYLNKIEQLIQTFLPFELEHAEVIATLYAGWNNLLLEDKKPTDEEIVYESRENWSKRKLTIERDLFFKSLKWMHDHRYIPIGIGKKVE